MYSMSLVMYAARWSPSVQMPEMNASERAWNSLRSCTGTPSISQIMISGSCSPKSATRSAAGPFSTILSASSLAIVNARARNPSIRRGVNAPVTSLRNRVRFGGSISIMPRGGMYSATRGSSRPTPAARLNLGST